MAVGCFPKTAGLDRAASNGYITDADSTVEVHMCNEAGLTPPCEGLPANANPSDYIQVKIISTIPTTFARVIGRDHFTSTLTAIARASAGTPTVLFNGAALAALKPSGPDTMTGNGNIILDVNNSGVFNNSTDNCGMSVVGNGNYSVDTAFTLVSGTHCQSGTPTLTGPVQSGAQTAYPPDITLLTPTITCSGNGTQTVSVGADGITTNTFSPGNYNGISINVSGHVHFSPGNYCFNVHISGGTGMRFNGNGGNYCNSVTFFASTGDVSWTGNVSNRFFAPTGGEYKNVLIYMPYGNNSALNINGNSGNMLTGSIIAVSSPITISGNSGTTGLHSQIIGYTVSLLGNSNTIINYVDGEQYAQANPSAIGLTK